jgi:hypothetical protein
MAHAICIKSLKVTDKSTLSPKRLARERKTAGIQKEYKNPSKTDTNIKVASIPIPPPFGILPEWELLLLALSIISSLKPYLATNQAPPAPNIIGHTK